MARTPPGTPMKTDSVIVEDSAGSCAPADPAATGAITPPQLFERRTTYPTTPQATVSPAGSASFNSVAGHSGVDHPLSAGETGLSVSFGEALSPHQLQLGGRGQDGVLSTPLLPLHTGTEERQWRPQDVSGILSFRERPYGGETPTGGTDSHHSDGENLNRNALTPSVGGGARRIRKLRKVRRGVRQRG